MPLSCNGSHPCRCRSLEILRLPGCTSLSDASLAAVLAAAPQLREMDVTGGQSQSRVLGAVSSVFGAERSRQMLAAVPRMLASQPASQRRGHAICMCCAPAAGCSGVKVSRPGSRFLRHKAARLQEGGLTDDSLRLLGQQPAQQVHQAQQQQAQQAQQRLAQPTQQAQQAQQQLGQPAGLQLLKAGSLSLTDGTLAALPPSLTCLSLRGCKRVSDSGLLQLLLHCPRLARLDAAGCSQLTAGGFGSYMPLGAQHGSRDHSTHSSNSSASTSSGSSQQAAADQDAEQQLTAFRRVVSTTSAVRLQRAALPKQACTREVLAWLTGQASSSSGGSGSGSSSSPASSASSGSSAGVPGRPALQRLELASCALLTEADLLALAASCPQLRSLQLSAAGLAAGPRLCASLAQRCRLLSCLSLSGAAGVGDADVALLLRELPGLLQLDLSGCTGITGAAFIERLQLHTVRQQQGASAVLTGLTQAAGAAVTVAPPAAAAAAPAAQVAAVSAAAERIPGRTALRVLRLDGCPISQAAAVAIGGICPHLETLSLRQCIGVTSAAAAALLWCCRNLRQLLLSGTQAVDLFVEPGAMPLHFNAAAAAAGVPCAEGLSPAQALLAGPPCPVQPSPLALVELPCNSRTVRCAGDWPSGGLLGSPRVQLA